MKSPRTSHKSGVKTEKTFELPVINEEFKRDESFNKVDFASMQSLDFIEGERSQIEDRMKISK
jgi:hypothetical protein